MDEAELRALDKEIADLLGWEHDREWRAPGGKDWFREVPRFSSAWEGFGLLAQEWERQEWRWEMVKARDFGYIAWLFETEQFGAPFFHHHADTVFQAAALVTRDVFRARCVFASQPASQEGEG